MLALSCLCGQVSIAVETPPDFINECNCSLCSKSGARWAYYPPSIVTVEGPTRAYRRHDKEDPAAELHFCGRCGATTHFTLTETAIARFGNVQMGVNMQLADEADLAGIELRFPNGRDWSGGSDFGYVRAPRVLGRDESAP